MRRIVVEVPREELLSHDTLSLRGIESFKVIHLLRQDPDTYAGVCAIRLKPKVVLQSLIGVVGFTNLRLLSKEIDGSIIVFIEGKRSREWVRPHSSREGYLYPPFELDGGVWRLTFFGTVSQVQATLTSLDNRGLHYQVVHSGDAMFESGSLLSALTGRQRQTLMTAYKKGYFDFPRRIKSGDLAELLGMSKSTLSQHLRMAEKRILDSINSGSAEAPAYRASGKTPKRLGMGLGTTSV